VFVFKDFFFFFPFVEVLNPNFAKKISKLFFPAQTKMIIIVHKRPISAGLKISEYIRDPDIRVQE